MIFDVHCHLDDEKFAKDFDAMIERAKKAGIGAMISNGTNISSNRKVLALAKKYDIVQAALGIYPVEALKMTDTEITDEFKFIRKHKDEILALGEIGVDFHHVKDERERQREMVIFERFLELAQKINKPVIVHSREAEREVIDILKRYNVPNVVMHCFCGSPELAQECKDQGWYFSIPTSIVRIKSFEKLAEIAGPKHTLTETDGPYQGPIRGERNEPANIKTAVKKIADVRRVSVPVVEKEIEENYKKVFL